MVNYDYLTKGFIKSHEFVADEAPIQKTEPSCRWNQNDPLPPSHEELQDELRKNFSSIFASTFNNYAQMEIACNISEASMRKYLKGVRPITFLAVTKFCIGAKLTVEKAIELFKLQGHIISPDLYRFDAVVINAVQCGDSIDVFYETCKECGLKKILDKLSHSE